MTIIKTFFLGIFCFLLLAIKNSNAISADYIKANLDANKERYPQIYAREDAQSKVWQYFLESTIRLDYFETGDLSCDDTQKKSFAFFLKENIEDIIDFLSFQSKQTNFDSSATLLKGSLHWSGEEYLTLVYYLLDKFHEGKIKKNLVYSAFTPSANSAKPGFIAYNYKHKKVQELCMRVKEIFHEDGNLIKFMDSILSGEQEGMLGAFCPSAKFEKLPSNMKWPWEEGAQATTPLAKLLCKKYSLAEGGTLPTPPPAYKAPPWSLAKKGFLGIAILTVLLALYIKLKHRKEKHIPNSINL